MFEPEHSLFLEAQDIVVSKKPCQLGPRGHQSLARWDHWQELTGEVARMN
jgi:hypothetical protein